MFVFALQLTFPYERVKDKGIELLSSSYDISVGSVERGWIPGRVYFKAVTFRTRPTKPDETATTFYIDKLEIDLGILPLIGMTASVDIDAKIGSGRVKGNISLPKFGKAGFKIDLDGSDLPGASLPVRGLLGLPISGKIDFSIEFEMPFEKNKMGRVISDWTKSEGHLDLSCPTGCTLGDGHTKLKPLLKNRTNQVMVGDGIDFGKVNLDSLSMHAVITPAVGDPEQHSSSYKPGRLEVTKFEVKSPDGELHVDYSMTLAQDFGESLVAGCLRFKGSDNLLKHDDTKKTYAAIQTTGAEIRSDGLFHIKLTDRFKDMKRLNLECGPNAKATTSGEDFSGTPPRPSVRPNLTVTPDEGRPTRPSGMPPRGEPGSPQPVPPPPPPPPPPARRPPMRGLPPTPAPAAAAMSPRLRANSRRARGQARAEPNPSAPPPSR